MKSSVDFRSTVSHRLLNASARGASRCTVRTVASDVAGRGEDRDLDGWTATAIRPPPTASSRYAPVPCFTTIFFPAAEMSFRSILGENMLVCRIDRRARAGTGIRHGLADRPLVVRQQRPVAEELTEIAAVGIAPGAVVIAGKVDLLRRAAGKPRRPHAELEVVSAVVRSPRDASGAERNVADAHGGAHRRRAAPRLETRRRSARSRPDDDRPALAFRRGRDDRGASAVDGQLLDQTVASRERRRDGRNERMSARREGQTGRDDRQPRGPID